jgi:flagellar biosynthetic protein FliQ
MKRKESARPIHRIVQAASREGCENVNLDQAVDLVRNTLLLALLVAAPMLIIGMVVGIVVSLAQAVTQIQEQTLTFIPKIVAMVASAIVLMPWMSHRLMEYATAMFTNGPLP